MIGGEHIRTVVVAGIKIPIHRATVAQDAALFDEDTGKTLEGVFDADRNIIVIKQGLAPTVELDTINHEILHALFLYSGARSFFAGAVKGDATEREETMIRILTPHLTALRWIK